MRNVAKFKKKSYLLHNLVYSISILNGIDEILLVSTFATNFQNCINYNCLKQEKNYFVLFYKKTFFKRQNCSSHFPVPKFIIFSLLQKETCTSKDILLVCFYILFVENMNFVKFSTSVEMKIFQES